MKYLIFIFKHRFRKNSLNNFLKCKKIMDIYIIDLSGPYFYFLFYPLIQIIQNIITSKKLTKGYFDSGN